MNAQQLEALRTIRQYLAHPDVQAMPFALPASNPLRALDAIIEQGEQEQTARPLQAIHTKVIGPTNAYPVARIRATSPRGSMLVELPDNLAAYEEDAHIYAARQLAQAYARHDREGGNPTGAAYWSARLVSGGIGGNMYAHIPQP
jgi:hypothetical protein